MSGDLEDFLRRAAQRRQAKAAEQQQQPAPRQRSQYSDHRTERVVRPEPEEILTAEIVEEEPDSFALRRRRIEEAKQAAKLAEAEAARKLRQVSGGRPKRSSAAVALSGNPTQELLAMLRQPGGIRQAILLREILDRPEHRW